MNDSRMILFLGNEYLTGKPHIQTISTAATLTTVTTTTTTTTTTITTTTTTTTDDYRGDYNMIIAVTDILA
jgi:hypothetical protein